MKRTLACIMVVGLVAALFSGCESSQKTAETKPSQEETLAHAVQRVVNQAKSRDPGMSTRFENAYAYAVFPAVGKGAFIVGGARGDGEVYEQGELIGTARLTQVTIGAQAGGQVYAEFIFFENEAALEQFKDNRLKLSAQVSAVAVRAGASADARYADGVMVFTMPEGGLMLEAAVGGQGFVFTPLGGNTPSR